MRVVYCTECKPARVIAVGVEARGAKHRAGTGVHEKKMKTMEAKGLSMNLGESPAEFIARIEKDYKAELV